MPFTLQLSDINSTHIESLPVMKHTRKIEAIDLFCGVGGLSAGLAEAGIRVIAGIDVDKACGYPFEVNHSGAKFIEQDVAKVTADDLNSLWSKDAVRLLAGCAPCQPFSSYARGKASDHLKWGMLYQFGRLVEETLPDLVTMENVPGLKNQEPFQEFLKTLESSGYQVCYQVVNAADFGVPQSRKRLVLLASKIGEISFPEPSTPGKKNWVTVKDAIGELEAIEHGQTSSSDPLHRSASLSELNLRRIRASKPGGTWRDWPQDLIADCHTKESGKHSAGVYGRMTWDAPAPTMTTLCNGFGNGRFGHPEQDRAISLREAAIFQSFPPDYVFHNPEEALATKTAARLIGNAVPPKLAEAVGLALVAVLNSPFEQCISQQHKRIV